MHKVTGFVRFISILIVLISLGKQRTLQYNLILVYVAETHTSAYAYSNRHPLSPPLFVFFF